MALWGRVWALAFELWGRSSGWQGVRSAKRAAHSSRRASKLWRGAVVIVRMTLQGRGKTGTTHKSYLIGEAAPGLEGLPEGRPDGEVARGVVGDVVQGLAAKNGEKISMVWRNYTSVG